MMYITVIIMLMILLAASLAINIWLAGELQRIHDADELEEVWADRELADADLWECDKWWEADEP